MADRQRSWLFPDKPNLPPIWREGDGKKTRYFIELKGQTVEFRPVDAYALWVLRRSYMSRMPKVPITELQLEGIDGVQRIPDYDNPEFVRATNEIYRELDIQIVYELMKGIVVPKDMAWAQEWTELGRPLPDDSTPEGRSLLRDIYLAQIGFSLEERVLLVRMIQTASEETAEAIEIAQELFRNYLGGTEVEGPSSAEQLDAHDAAGRDHDDNARVEQDAPEVVQDPPRGSANDDRQLAQHGDEELRVKPARRRTKAAARS